MVAIADRKSLATAAEAIDEMREGSERCAGDTTTKPSVYAAEGVNNATDDAGGAVVGGTKPATPGDEGAERAASKEIQDDDGTQGNGSKASQGHQFTLTQQQQQFLANSNSGGANNNASIAAAPRSNGAATGPSSFHFHQLQATMTDALNAKRLQGLHTTQDPAAPGVSTADVLDDVNWGVLHDALVFDKRQRKKRRATGAAGVDAEGHPDDAGATTVDADAAAMETDSAAGAAHDGSATTVDGDGVEGGSGAAASSSDAEGLFNESVLGHWLNLLLEDSRGRLAAIRRSKSHSQKVAKQIAEERDAEANASASASAVSEASASVPAMSTNEMQRAAEAVGAASKRLFHELDNSLDDEEEELELYVKKLQTMIRNTLGHVVIGTETGSTEVHAAAPGEAARPQPAFTISKTAETVAAASAANETLKSIISSADRKSPSSTPALFTPAPHKGKKEEQATAAPHGRISQCTHEDYMKVLGFGNILPT